MGKDSRKRKERRQERARNTAPRAVPNVPQTTATQPPVDQSQIPVPASQPGSQPPKTVPSPSLPPPSTTAIKSAHERGTGDQKSPTSHQYIRLASHSLSLQEAANRILEGLTAYGIRADSAKFLQNIATLQPGQYHFKVTDRHGKAKDVDLWTLLQGAIETGEVPEIDRLRWRDSDPFGSLNISTNMPVPMLLSSGPHTTDELVGPGLATNNVVAECLEDVSVYRRLTADESHYRNGFKPCFRAFRSYLTSCITALDAWVNREAFFALRTPSTRISLQDQKILSSMRIPLDLKFKKWMPIISGGEIDDSSHSWNDYQTLKNLRNRLLHVNEPEYVFRLEDASKILNLCHFGVGQFLLDLYKLVRRAPLAVVYRVRYAPTAVYQKP